MNKKWTALLCTAAMAVTLLAGCGGGGDTASTEASSAASAGAESGSDVVVVGTNPTFAPFEYQDDEGNMTGFDLDLMEAIGEDQGFDVEFQSLEFDALTGALTTGQIDAVAAGMSITPERLESVAFSDPYIDASLSIMVAADSDIAGPDDLEGKVVGAQIGTTGADEVTALQDEGTIAEGKILDNYNTCLQELISGGCDAVIIDLPVGEEYVDQRPDDVKLVGEPYEAVFYGIAVDPENTELLDKINAGLANVIEDGTYDELCEKYELTIPQSIKDGSAKEEVAALSSESAE